MSKAIDVPNSLIDQINETAAQARSIQHSVLGELAERDLRDRLLAEMKKQDAILVVSLLR